MFTNIFRICSLALAVFLSVLFISGTNAFANTDEINQAAVVIDTGKEIKTACITFRGDSISGTQALELANAQPVFQSFSGNGSAVCSLCGVGCPSGNSCLTCMGSSFWNYFRAPKDSSKFSLSGAGAGVVRVKDGDVEGWRFGIGQKPPFKSFNTICGIEIKDTPVTGDQPTKAKSLPKIQTNQVSSSPSSVENDSSKEIKSKVLGRTATRKVDLPKRSEVNTNVNESNNPDYLMYGLVVVSGVFLLFSGVKLFQNLAGKQKNSP